MTTVNDLGNGLSGTTGSGSFVGSTSPTITTPVIAQINDANGNEILALTPVASAVNFILINNNATGSGPVLLFTGGDTNVSGTYNCKGTGAHNFNNAGANFVKVAPAATTFSPTVSASGTDTNVLLSLAGKGNSGVAIQGTTAGGDATSGNVGEYISSTIASASAVNVSSGVDTDITSISLTAGDWDVWGSMVTKPAGTTTTSLMVGWTSTTSATQPNSPNNGSYHKLIVAVVAGSSCTLPTGMQRLSISSTTSIFLSCNIQFAVSTMQAYGFIGARRVR